MEGMHAMLNLLMVDNYLNRVGDLDAHVQDRETQVAMFREELARAQEQGVEEAVKLHTGLLRHCDKGLHHWRSMVIETDEMIRDANHANHDAYLDKWRDSEFLPHKWERDQGRVICRFCRIRPDDSMEDGEPCGKRPKVKSMETMLNAGPLNNRARHTAGE